MYHLLRIMAALNSFLEPTMRAASAAVTLCLGIRFDVSVLIIINYKDPSNSYIKVPQKIQCPEADQGIKEFLSLSNLHCLIRHNVSIMMNSRRDTLSIQMLLGHLHGNTSYRMTGENSWAKVLRGLPACSCREDREGVAYPSLNQNESSQGNLI